MRPANGLTDAPKAQDTGAIRRSDDWQSHVRATGHRRRLGAPQVAPRLTAHRSDPRAVPAQANR